jgi:hypothetical protein
MPTEQEVARYSYVLRRKEFFNQKSYDIFEKLQVGVFAYVAYIITIVTGFRKKEWSTDDVHNLTTIADTFLILFICIFLVFISINIGSWWRYEKEENVFLGKSVGVEWRQIPTWVEAWIIAAAITEGVVAHLLKNYAISVLV